MKKDEKHLRKAIVEACRWMNATGLNQGTSGNISARHGDAMIITPTGVPYDQIGRGRPAQACRWTASTAPGKGRSTRPRSGASTSTS